MSNVDNTGDLLAQFLFLYTKALRAIPRSSIDWTIKRGQARDLIARLCLREGRMCFRVTEEWERTISVGCFECCDLHAAVCCALYNCVWRRNLNLNGMSLLR